MKIILFLTISFAICSCDNWANTPGGISIPIQCIYEIQQEYQVEKQNDGSLEVQHPNQTQVMIIDPCEEFLNNSLNSTPEKRISDSGWIATSVSYGTSFTTFDATWTVPSKPSLQENQLIYLFTGLENSANNEIIQPVLQFGNSPAGGGKYWGLACWYVTSSGHAMHSPLIQVNSGEVITGTMVNIGGNSWTISAWSNTRPQETTTLTVSGIPTQSVATVTLEAYTINSCAEYPASSFNARGLTLQENRRTITPTWNYQTYFSSCSQSVHCSSASCTINYT